MRGSGMSESFERIAGKLDVRKLRPLSRANFFFVRDPPGAPEGASKPR
jgi:hypothetical protein